MEFTNENYAGIAAFAATDMHCGGKQFLQVDPHLKGNINDEFPAVLYLS